MYAEGHATSESVKDDILSWKKLLRFALTNFRSRLDFGIEQSFKKLFGIKI